MTKSFVGLQASGGNVVEGTNRPVTFEKGQHRVTIPAGKLAYTDPVELSYVKSAAGLEDTIGGPVK